MVFFFFYSAFIVIITPLELYRTSVIFCVTSRFYLHMIEISDLQSLAGALIECIETLPRAVYGIRPSVADGYFSGPASSYYGMNVHTLGLTHRFIKEQNK